MDFLYFCGMNIEPIAYFRSPLTSKFGIPRQSGIVAELRGRIEFVPSYRNADALRGLQDYDYLWIIWGFSENVDAEKHPMVRPPLLGGNERVGVWATRSPFRPNNLGLSSVRIGKIDTERVAIDVYGADLMDGTPIYDIKPSVPSKVARTSSYSETGRTTLICFSLLPNCAPAINSPNALVVANDAVLGCSSMTNGIPVSFSATDLSMPLSPATPGVEQKRILTSLCVAILWIAASWSSFRKYGFKNT